MSTEHGPHTTRRNRPPSPYVSSPGWSGRPLDDLTSLALGRCSSMNPDLFYPQMDEGDGFSAMATVALAKRVCRTCTVKTPCLVYALETDERFGVWGGEGKTIRANIRASWPTGDAADMLEEAA